MCRIDTTNHSRWNISVRPLFFLLFSYFFVSFFFFVRELIRLSRKTIVQSSFVPFGGIGENNNDNRLITKKKRERTTDLGRSASQRQCGANQRAVVQQVHAVRFARHSRLKDVCKFMIFLIHI